MDRQALILEKMRKTFIGQSVEFYNVVVTITNIEQVYGHYRVSYVAVYTEDYMKIYIVGCLTKIRRRIHQYFGVELHKIYVP